MATRDVLLVGDMKYMKKNKTFCFSGKKRYAVGVMMKGFGDDETENYIHRRL